MQHVYEMACSENLCYSLKFSKSCSTMLLLLLCFLCFGADACHSKAPNTDVFEFDICPQESSNVANHEQGRVVYNMAGMIRKHEKYVRIPVVIPYCMELTYVRVVVDNSEAPPFVDLDRDLLMVNIKYRPKQASESSYLITAKGLPIANCATFSTLK